MTQTFKLRKLAFAVASAAALGFAGQASAAPMFTIDLSAIMGGSTDTYTGDFFSGTSTELLTMSSPTTHTANGWMQVSNLSNGGVSQVPFGTNNFSPFQLYVTFTLTDKLQSGTMNAPGSTYTLTGLDFVVWADKGKDTVLTKASISGNTSTPSSVGGNYSNDTALAVGSLISGQAGLSALGGAYLNSINSFAVCDGSGTADLGGTQISASACTDDTGVNFFIDPKPFYELAFTEFNNTAQGYDVNPLNGDIAISSASGGIDFNRVPEPGMLSLLGLGLAGIGATVRRRQAN